MLKFSPMRDNAKLSKLAKASGKRGWTFALLSGHTCPFADACLAKVIPVGNSRRVWDGPDQQFRCWSASQEAFYPAVYRQRKHNMDLVHACNGVGGLVDLIEASLPARAELIRVHIGGDFYSATYFAAWMVVAEHNPHVHFYAYTKSWPFVSNYQKKNDIPANFSLTYSVGGAADGIFFADRKRGYPTIRCATVVGSPETVTGPIDRDDSLAAFGPHGSAGDFCLLAHGIQPKSSIFSADVLSGRNRHG